MFEAWHTFGKRLEPYLERLSILVAYVALLVLWRLAQLSMPYDDGGAKAAAAWIVLFCLPVWLMICMVAIRSGWRVGGDHFHCRRWSYPSFYSLPMDSTKSIGQDFLVSTFTTLRREPLSE